MGQPNTITVNAGGVSASIKVKRPRFDDLLKPYQKIDKELATLEDAKQEPRYQIITDEEGNPSSIANDYCKRFKLVHPELLNKCLNRESSYQNTCATRISYAFNHGGYKIKSGEFNDIYSHAKIFASVIGIVKFLKSQFGSSDIKFDGDANHFKSKITGKKGIIVFKIKWLDATGHVTLWDGKECVDDSDDFGKNPTDMLFWELK
jgi:hypothetical protein